MFVETKTQQASEETNTSAGEFFLYEHNRCRACQRRLGVRMALATMEPETSPHFYVCTPTRFGKEMGRLGDKHSEPLFIIGTGF